MTAREGVTPGRPRRSHARRPPPTSRRRRTTRALPLAGLVIAGFAGLIVHFANGSTTGNHAPGRVSPASPPSTTVTASAASATGLALDPSYFTPGSCVAFSPTKGDRHETVFLDAGHGGPDPGAVGVTQSGAPVHEAVETLAVVLKTTALLRADGYRVVASRTRQTAAARPLPGDMNGNIFTVKGELREIASRDVCANVAHANILIGVYFDAGGSPQDAGSVSTYDQARPFWRTNVRLASLLQRDVLTSMNAHGWGIPNDGVVSDVSLGGPALSAGGAAYGHLMVIGPAKRGYFSTPSTMPGALIEPLFITDPLEGSIATSSAGQRAIATGLAKAVEQFFSTAPAS